MALSLQYTGARPYTELKLSGVVYGFGRGAIRSDIPEDFITSKIIPMISNGATSWVVIDDAEEIKTTKMLDAVKEEPKVLKPKKVVQQKVTTPDVVALVDSDALLEEQGFSSKLTRAQMMAWCSEKSIATANTSTKASMTDLAREYVAGLN